jgi:hypothetical protein
MQTSSTPESGSSPALKAEVIADAYLSKMAGYLAATNR